MQIYDSTTAHDFILQIDTDACGGASTWSKEQCRAVLYQNAAPPSARPFYLWRVSHNFDEHIQLFEQAHGELQYRAAQSVDSDDRMVELVGTSDFTNLIKRFTLDWPHSVTVLTIDDPDKRRFHEIEATSTSRTVRERKRQLPRRHQRSQSQGPTEPVEIEWLGDVRKERFA